MAATIGVSISTNFRSNSAVLPFKRRPAVDKASDPKNPVQFGSKSAKAADLEAASLALWQAAALSRAPLPEESKATETPVGPLEPALGWGSLGEAGEKAEARATCAGGGTLSARGSPSARRRVRRAVARETKTKLEAADAENEAAAERAERARTASGRTRPPARSGSGCGGSPRARPRSPPSSASRRRGKTGGAR